MPIFYLKIGAPKQLRKDDESAPKSRVFEIVGTVAKYYFDGMPSVQLFERSIVQLITHN